MEAFNRNSFVDSEVYVEGSLLVGDTTIILNAPEEETLRCYYCEALLDHPLTKRGEYGLICYSCHQINYDRPASRNATGGQYQNMRPEIEPDYAFLINEIEVHLARRNQKANAEAIELAQRAILMSMRTPDAYLYKALCLYHLTNPKIKLVLNSAEDILTPLGTARRLNESYKLFKIISGMIAGRYFRTLEFNIGRMMLELHEKRPEPSAGINAYANPRSGRYLRDFEKLQRVLIVHIRQFTICYEISPNPLFLQREIEYFSGQYARDSRLNTPILALQVDNSSLLPDTNNFQALQEYLSALERGRYTILYGTESVETEIKEKTKLLKKINPGYTPPPLRLISPLSNDGLTLEQIKSALQTRIAELVQEEQRQQQIRERTRQEKIRVERAEQKRLKRQNKFQTILVTGVTILGICVALWLLGIVYGWFTDEEFLFSEFLIAFLKMPLVLISLSIASGLFVLFWFLELLTGWIFGWEWCWSTTIWSWAWDDVTVNWFWNSTAGFYIFSAVLIWGGIIKVIDYWDKK